MKNFLNKNINILRLIACSESKCYINIIPSKDDIGGIYKQNVILPKRINISKKNVINKHCYIYKILFSLLTKKFNFYLNNNENIDYKLIASLITVKKINKNIFNNFLKLKDIIKKIYLTINKKRENLHKLNGRKLLLEILIKKMTYEHIKIKINLTKEEKELIFEVENIIKLSDKNIINYIDSLYIKLCKIHKKYENINLYLPWGYLYQKNKQKFIKFFKNNIKNKIKEKKTSKYINYKITNINEKKEKQIYSIFDYKKTYDEYRKGNKSKKSSKDSSNIKNLKRNNITKSEESSNSFIKTNIINEININIIKEENENIKRLLYKEWDFTKKIYKYNWCYLFIKKIKIYKENLTVKLEDNIKKEIFLFKKYFKTIINKKEWKKRTIYGEDIDIDLIIDEYKNLKNNNICKIYKNKHKLNRDISISILFDSSLSTESYLKNIQIINIIKDITNIIACGIDNLIDKFFISTFHSNTRYDCRYIILKDFNDKWKNKKFYMKKIIPTGYTRIGPALRHSITLLKKIKSEKKILLLITDGKPTDYDEYEGNYGINDIKNAINEGIKNKIKTKILLINEEMNFNYYKLFKNNEYFTISDKIPYNIQLIKIFNKIIN